MSRLGRPRLHLRSTGSTNEPARALAAGGAPHGTLVTAAAQTAGRGRQGRSWIAPAGRALLMSIVIRDPPALLSLRAGLAVADAVGPQAAVKWPNDVLVSGAKVAGVLVEARPQEAWAVLGIGVNVALDPAELPAGAGTLGRSAGEVDDVLSGVLSSLARRLEEPAAATLTALRGRDALLGRQVRWAGGSGAAAGILETGALQVRRGDGTVVALDAGEVHLEGEWQDQLRIEG